MEDKLNIMSRHDQTIFVRLKKNIRNKLLTGLLVILPVYVTLFVVKFLYRFIGAEFLPLLKRVFKHDFAMPETVINPLLIIIGILITFTALYFIGVFATNFLGKQIILFYERIINSTPIVKSIYSSSKQVIHTFSSSGKKSFKRVVVVEFPRRGLNMIGFVTGTITNKEGVSLTGVFVPSTPNPTTGFLIYLPKEEIMDTNMTVEDAIKLIISGGILMPEDIDFQTAEYQTERTECS